MTEATAEPTTKETADEASVVGDYPPRPYSEAISDAHRAFLEDNYPDQLPAPADENAEPEPVRVEDQ